MKMKFYFRMHEMIKLVTHAKKATERIGSIDELYYSQYSDISDVPPGLLFCKDEGIYFLSNGRMDDPENRTAKEIGLIAYAIGYDPGKDPDFKYNTETAYPAGKDFKSFLSEEHLQSIATSNVHNGILEVQIADESVDWYSILHRPIPRQYKDSLFRHLFSPFPDPWGQEIFYRDRIRQIVNFADFFFFDVADVRTMLHHSENADVRTEMPLLFDQSVCRDMEGIPPGLILGKDDFGIYLRSNGEVILADGQIDKRRGIDQGLIAYAPQYSADDCPTKIQFVSYYYNRKDFTEFLQHGMVAEVLYGKDDGYLLIEPKDNQLKVSWSKTAGFRIHH